MIIQNKKALNSTTSLCLSLILLSTELYALKAPVEESYEDQVKRVAAVLPGGNEIKIREEATDQVMQDLKYRKRAYHAEDAQYVGHIMKKVISPAVGLATPVLFAIPSGGTQIAGIVTAVTSAGIRGAGTLLEMGGEKAEVKYLAKMSLNPSKEQEKMGRKVGHLLKKKEHAQEKIEEYKNLDENSKMYRFKKFLHLSDKQKKIKKAEIKNRKLDNNIKTLRTKWHGKILQEANAILENGKDRVRNIYRYVLKNEYLETQIQRSKPKIPLFIEREENEVILNGLLEKNNRP